MCGDAQLRLRVQFFQRQIARLSVPAGARGRTFVGSSGQAVETAEFRRLPQMPCVMLVPVRKQIPRHWMFRGFVSPGTVTVIDGLHGAPSARRVVTTPVVPHAPVRVLQRRPPVQCELLEQNP